MISSKLKELLLQSLEHERGGVLVYQTALECVLNDDLREEWEEYLEQTREHVDALTRTLRSARPRSRRNDAGLQDRAAQRQVARGRDEDGAWRPAIRRPPSWSRASASCSPRPRITPIGSSSESVRRHAEGGAQRRCRRPTMKSKTRKTSTSITPRAGAGSCGCKSLGLKAVLPPPEEKKDVKTAEEAAKVKKQVAARRK